MRAWAKPNGHWALPEESDDEGAILSSDIPPRPEDEHGDRWGRWTLNTSAPRTLDIVVIPGYVYSVPIDECAELAGESRWLRHMNNKNWTTPEDIGWLVRALADILGHWSW